MQRVLLVSAIVLLTVFATGRVRNRYFHSDLRLTVMDVGQGDSILIEFPGGKTLLVDAGGGIKDFNMGKKEIVPELARRGILSLDAALLTHPDADHGFGFLGVLPDLEVKRFWIHSAFTHEGKEFARKIFNELETRNIPLDPIQAPREFTWGGVVTKIHYLGAREKTTNNRSLVVELRYAGCTVLLTGDIEKKAETELLRSLGRIDLLKVAHHGSRTSSSEDFLRKVQPRWAVISVGAGNHFGHPNDEVLERYRRFRTQVFRTDFHGFVEYSIDSNGKVVCRNALGFCGEDSCFTKPSLPEVPGAGVLTPRFYREAPRPFRNRGRGRLSSSIFRDD